MRLATLALSALIVSLAVTDASAATMVARVAGIRGTVEVKLPSGNTWNPTFRGDHLPEGTRVRTGSASTVRLLMTDRSVLMLGSNSELRVATYKVQKRKRRTSLRLKIGWLWARVRKAVSAEDTYEVTTANAVAGVRGTDLIVSTDGQNISSFACLHGVVDVADVAGTKSVTIAELQQVAADAEGLGDEQPIEPSEIRSIVAPFAAAQLIDAPPLPDELPPGPSEPPPAWIPPSTPPIDLEPGTGTGRLRGRVEVRDQ